MDVAFEESVVLALGTNVSETRSFDRKMPPPTPQ
jgi:hypothetical protein